MISKYDLDGTYSNEPTFSVACFIEGEPDLREKKRSAILEIANDPDCIHVGPCYIRSFVHAHSIKDRLFLTKDDVVNYVELALDWTSEMLAVREKDMMKIVCDEAKKLKW